MAIQPAATPYATSPTLAGNAASANPYATLSNPTTGTNWAIAPNNTTGMYTVPGAAGGSGSAYTGVVTPKTGEGQLATNLGLPTAVNALNQGQAAYNQAQPLVSNYASNINSNPVQNLLATGGTNNSELMAYLSAAGVNTQPQVTANGYNSGTGITLSADQVNGLTPAQQTQLNSELAPITTAQQSAVQLFRTQVEGQMGAGAISMDQDSISAGEAAINAIYNNQASLIAVNAQTQATTARANALNGLITAGTAQGNTAQGQELALTNTLLGENTQGQSTALNAAQLFSNQAIGQAGVQQQGNAANAGLLGSLGNAVGSALGSA
jgi:hypothetical protein